MAEVQVKRVFVNPQPDDAGPDTYVKPKHWNAVDVFANGGSDGELITWDPVSLTKATYRTLVGGTGITVTVGASSITIAQSAGSLTGSGTANRVARWTASSVLGDSAIRDDGNIISVGAALDTTAAVNMGGSFTGSSDAYGLRLAHTLTPAVNGDGYLFNTAAAAQINEAASGTHDTFGTMILRPIVVGAGVAALTNAVTLKLLGAPTGAVNNFTLWSTGGSFRFDGAGPHAIGGVLNVNQQLTLRGTHVPTGGGSAFAVQTVITAPVGGSEYGIDIFPTINEAVSGTHVDFASALIEAPVIGAAAATLTNATTLKVLGVPTAGSINRSFWVTAGVSQFDGIVAVSGAGGVVNTTNVGLEFRGSATPSLTAFNRTTVLHLPMVYDALVHEWQISGLIKGGFKTSADALFSITGTHTGSVQSEMARMNTTVTGVAATNTFGLVLVPTFIEAASGTHGQLTALYIAPAFTNGVATTTAVYGINIDTISAGTISPTTATALRIAVPTGGTNNFGIQMTGSLENTSAVPHSFGTLINTGIEMFIAGTFASAQAFSRGLQIGMTLTAATDGGNMIGLYVNPQITERGAGNHAILAGIFVEPGFIAGAATASQAVGIYIAPITVAGGTSTAAALFIENQPSGGTNNFAIQATGSIYFTSAGAHGIGTVPNLNAQLRLGGTFAGDTGGAFGFDVTSTLNPGAGLDGMLVIVEGTINEFSSGTHTRMASVGIFPSFGAGVAATTDMMALYVGGFTAPSGTVNASGIKINAAPTGATTNYALWAVDGSVRFGGVGPHAIGVALDGTRQLSLGGSFTSSGNGEAFRIISTVTVGASNSAFGLTVTPTLVEGTGGVHPDFYGIYVEPTITAGTSTLTSLYGIRVAGLAAATGTTNAYALHLVAPTGATNNFSLLALGLTELDGDVALFATGSFGSGSKVMFVGNATTAPTTNPTGGGILYAEAGAGKWRGSGGTVTTFGPAEPHCPSCGRDFMHEWENERTGYLAVCMSCLTDEIGTRSWIIKRAGRV